MAGLERWARRAFAAGLAAFVAGCADEPQVPDSAASTRDSATLSPRTSQMWADSCALCHVDGNAGAPRVGRADEWASRLEQGEAALLSHTVEGLNDMPPLGYCMACERDDFLAMIRFMADGARQTEGR